VEEPHSGLGGQSLAPHRGDLGSIPRVSLRFVVDEVALGQSFLQVLRFPLPVSFHQYSILVFTYTLMLSERKADGTWKPSKKKWSWGNWGVLDRKELSLLWFLTIYGSLFTLPPVFFCWCNWLVSEKQTRNYRDYYYYYYYYYWYYYYLLSFNDK